MMAPRIQAVSAQPTSPEMPATMAGDLKMPAPMTMPTMMAMAPSGLSRRRGDSRPALKGVAPAVLSVCMATSAALGADLAVDVADAAVGSSEFVAVYRGADGAHAL